MDNDRFQSFEEFWPFYLTEHSRVENRWVHFVGTSAALSTVALAAARKQPKLLWLAPLLGYGFAWFGHFCIEKNRPATFKYPLWSLQGDFRMWSKMVRGQLH